MKCIHCRTDSRLKDRRDGRCPRCKHRFAFEPTRDPLRVTDMQFHSAIQRVSRSGELHFTERNLWYELNQKWMRRPFWRRPYGWYPPAGAAGGTALGLLGVVKLALFPLAGIGLAAGLLLGAYLSRGGSLAVRPPRRPPRVPFDRFRSRYLERWRVAHGEPPKLVFEPDPRVPARAVPDDVAAFSFDRAVVTQHADTAAMLVANRFHFEHNCAVLSLDGYPHGISDTVKAMLRRNPRLTVFTLHDYTPAGLGLSRAMRGPAWFPEPTVRVVDVALDYGDLIGHDLPLAPGMAAWSAPGVRDLRLADRYSPTAGWPAELAALPPRSVIHMLTRAFSLAGLPGEPAYDQASGAADSYGVIWIDTLPGYVPGSGSGAGGASDGGFG